MGVEQDPWPRPLTRTCRRRQVRPTMHNIPPPSASRYPRLTRIRAQSRGVPGGALAGRQLHRGLRAAPSQARISTPACAIGSRRRANCKMTDLLILGRWPKRMYTAPLTLRPSLPLRLGRPVAARA
eukprot:5947982-Pyramimonas_sp.AAC.1